MINTQKIRQQVDLITLIGVDFHKKTNKNGGEYAAPCPLCNLGKRDCLVVQPNVGKWFCRKCSPRPFGYDCFDFIQKRDSVSFQEAARILSSGNVPTTDTLPKPTTKPTPETQKPPNQAWQEAAFPFVIECAHGLRDKADKATRSAFDYLINRGLDPKTIHNAMLGFNPKPRKLNNGAWLAAGITIPSFTPDSLFTLNYINVRLTKQQVAKYNQKYRALSGSKLSSLYNAHSLENAHTAIIVEGEFDCLLLSQFAPEGVAVVTMGSATSTPSLNWRLHFVGIDSVYIALDTDNAGKLGAEKWQQIIPHIQCMPILPNGDVTDSYNAGFDLLRWVYDGCNL